VTVFTCRQKRALSDFTSSYRLRSAHVDRPPPSCSEELANLIHCLLAALGHCEVSFKDVKSVRQSVEVDPESLYKAVARAVTIFRAAPWGERIASGTVLDVEVREPGTKHAVTLGQVERWLAGAGSPNEALKKVKLKMSLVRNS
jgi:hypothetical protein